MTNRLGLASGLLCLLTASCSSTNFDVAPALDAGDDSSLDAASGDTGADTGVGPGDTGVDSTIGDTGSLDTGSLDTGSLDTGSLDTGTDTRADAPTDATTDSATDTGVTDSGSGDSISVEGGPIDGGPIDGGPADGGCAPFDPGSGIIWVDKGATASGVGSVACPHKTIAAAVAQAKAASFKGTIRVKGPTAGTYVYDEATPVEVPTGWTLSGDDETKVQIVANGNCPISGSSFVNCAVWLNGDAKLEKVSIAPITGKKPDFGVVTTYSASGARPVLSFVTITSMSKSGIVVMNGADLRSVTSKFNLEAGVAVNTGRLFADDSGSGGRPTSLTDNGTQGVFFAPTATADFVNVQILRNVTDGIKAETGSSSRSLSFKTCTVQQNSGAGADVNGGSLSVDGGSFSLNGTAGFKVSGNAQLIALNADFSTNKTNGLELISASGFTHKLTGVNAESNNNNGVLWGGAGLTITSTLTRKGSFSKNGVAGISQGALGAFDMSGGTCDSNGNFGIRFGVPGSVSGTTFNINIANVIATTNGTSTVLGSGIFVGAATRGAVKIRGSKLTGNTGGGLFFDYATTAPNTLDIGTTSDVGCNDFGSTKNGKTAVCLANSGAKGSQSAEGDTWSGPLSITDATLWQLSLSSECYTNPTYYEVTYRKATGGGDTPVITPTVVPLCPIVIGPG